MYFQQFYLGCLAQASYLIGSGGEAAVIDPRRDVDDYLEVAKREGLAIRHVIETHLHADFVSGHRELAERTGARIYFGASAGAAFEHVAVRENDEISFGSVTLRFLETPGHTPESVCVLVIDRAVSPNPRAVLTGDTLFIGDVGRPDLLGSEMPATELAGLLYDSLHEKLLRLPDSVAVFPGHGAGSLCGKNISSETSSTIGRQRLVNPALQPMPRDEFVRQVTADLPEAPPHFRRDVELNRSGPAALSDLPPLLPLDPDTAAARAQEGAVFLDVRPPDVYGASHVAGSFQIGLTGQFATWAGTVLPPRVPVILVAADRKAAEEARMRLARVGVEDVAGYLDGGAPAWARSGRPVGETEQIDAAELQKRLAEGAPLDVLDVRRPGEWQTGRIERARGISLHELTARAAELDSGAPVAAICAGGYRSSIATSLLERAGFRKITNVVGGMAAWSGAGFETV